MEFECAVVLYNGFDGIALFSNWWESHAGGRTEDMSQTGGYNEM